MQSHHHPFLPRLSLSRINELRVSTPRNSHRSRCQRRQLLGILASVASQEPETLVDSMKIEGDSSPKPSPPCFMALPSELQMKILSFLPGADIAKAGCVCKELQYLSCNNELWKKKFAEEFGMMNRRRRSAAVLIRWKDEFKAHASLRAKRKAAEKAEAIAKWRYCRWFPHVDIPGANGMARYSDPLAMQWLF